MPRIPAEFLEAPLTPPQSSTPQLDALEQQRPLTRRVGSVDFNDLVHDHVLEHELDDVNAALLGAGRPPRAPRRKGGARARLRNWTSQSFRVAGVKRTTVLVSLDGVRPSYLQSHSAQLPHLLSLERNGVSAQMQPSFPSLTFPNHWSMLTGLYPGVHGIVANEFWTQERGAFDYGNRDSWDPWWWGGEPMWSVVQRAGRRAANVMWPGPPTTAAGISPHHFVPYRRLSPHDKLSLVTHYFDQPPTEAPSLILAYLPDVDQAGHAAGPDSQRVTDALEKVDEFVGELVGEIRERNMSHIVDLVVVSDHGMAQLSASRLLFLDDLLGPDLYADIAHRDGWPAFGLWFNSDVTDYTPHVAQLESKMNGSFSVYTHETMPERWHFEGPRVAPVYVVPDLGWVVTDHDEYERYKGFHILGAHGYDNTFPEMQAVFFALGPAADQIRDKVGANSAAAEGTLSVSEEVAWTVDEAADAETSELRKREVDADEGQVGGTKQGWASVHPPVMSTFANLNIFNLILRLQGVEEYAPPNNGTRGFWDHYF